MPRLRRMSVSTIESLEQRIVPSVTMTQLDLDSDGSADDLRIVGGNESTKIKITDEGVGQGSMLLDLDINGDGDFADVGDLQVLLFVVDDTRVIDLQLGGGNDQVVYALSDSLLNSTRRLIVDLGKGNDEFSLLGANHLIGNGSLLDIDLLAGAGNDLMTVDMPSVLNSTFLIDANMGDGNDRVEMSARLGSGTVIDNDASVGLSFELGKGKNSVQASMDLDVGVSTKADVDLDILGGTGIDEVVISTTGDIGNGTLSSTFVVNAELSGGNDVFDYRMSKLDLNANSELWVRGSGGSGNDRLGVTDSLHRVINVKGFARFDLIGGAGNDQLHSRLAAEDGQLLLQGALRVNIDGQDGIDTIEALLNVAAASTGLYSLVAQGGAGKDAFLLGLETNGASLTLGLDGTLVIDGGQGIDKLQTTVPQTLVEVQLVETFV